MKCQNSLCRKEIEEDKHICVWQPNDKGSLTVYFLCEPCSIMLEEDQQVERTYGSIDKATHS